MKTITGSRVTSRGGAFIGIGYAFQGQDTSFDREVRNGLLSAAEREHIELIVVDNRYQPKIALRSADYLIKEEVDLVIEFQTDELIAPAIATKYLEANIPFIAIDIPHPGATYFGANNYQAGLMAGHYLGAVGQEATGTARSMKFCWSELHRAGSFAESRMRGVQSRHWRDHAHSGALPQLQHRWRRPVSDHARTGAQTPAGIQRQTRAGGSGERFQRSRRIACI